jgi:hypothetical protein
VISFREMTLELGKMAERLKRAGYPVGGKLLSDAADSWEKAGLIPHNLPNTEQSSLERETNWGVWRTVEAGGKSVQVFERELKQKGINVSDYARDLMRSKNFVTLKRLEQIKIARSTVGGLGFTKPPTTDQLLQRIDFGDPKLEYLPPEAAVALRLGYKDQPLGEYLYAGMKPITDSDGDPRVFGLDRREGGSWLRGARARPGSGWDLGDEIVFRLRK